MRWQVVICVCFLVLTEATTFHRRSENLSRKARNNDDEKTNQTKDQETSPSPQEEEEITTTEAYIQPVTTTTESTSTEAPTTQAPTPAPGDLAIAERLDAAGNAVNQIDGEVKLNGKHYEVNCECKDSTTTTTSTPPADTTCSNYHEYKITKLHSALTQMWKGVSNTSKQEVLQMLPQSANIEFAPVRSTMLCDLDHRDQGQIMSGNGGDAVEFMIALQAFQSLGRGKLAGETVVHFLREYLKQTAPRPFYFRTSKDAVQHLNQELGHFTALDGNPRAGDQAQLLGAGCPRDKHCGLMSANGMGDVVLKGMLSSEGKYFVNQTLVRHFIKAFFQHKWANPTDTQLVVDGTKLEDQFRHQKAVVIIKTNPVCHREGTAPILRLPLQRKGDPTAGGIYVYQHDAVTMRREELAHFFAGHLSALRRDLSVQHAAALMKLMITSLGNRALEQTMRTIAKGLPIFGVELVRGDPSAAGKQLPKDVATAKPSETKKTSNSEVDIGEFLDE